jgi:ankyrin repeat protein
MRQLLALGASVIAQDEQGRTALIAAAHQNNLAIRRIKVLSVGPIETCFRRVFKP